ncbi:hypothetical protein VitviT2T_008949 [Vitis vinifera]|uniref:Uncharacterized protein n=1 Tax=Vitis vinifera TaxID=29760 RepID=A0ABY9C4W3_VITVI|nr:hypothetical protein VitviT2T_008949 [Vitis vinifera]
MSYIRIPVRPTSHLLRMSHIRNSVRRHPTFSGCLTSGILSADIPPSPDVLHPELCAADVPPSPNVSHLEFCPPTSHLLRMSYIRNSVRLTSHLLRMSHIRNSVRRHLTFSGCLTSGIMSGRRPTFSGCLTSGILSASVPPSLDISHPTPDTGWERRAIQLPRSDMSGSSDSAYPESIQPTIQIHRVAWLVRHS